MANQFNNLLTISTEIVGMKLYLKPESKFLRFQIIKDTAVLEIIVSVRRATQLWKRGNFHHFVPAIAGALRFLNIFNMTTTFFITEYFNLHIINTYFYNYHLTKNKLDRNHEMKQIANQ
uniref:Uncharacterized protein n=1 Tax=Glossina pallidipes TaxID=7398 RepID=A0A1A9ZGG6_GLOPL